MANLIKDTFPTPPSSLVNYNFTDYLVGLGYATFYGIIDQADDESLTRLPVDSYNMRRVWGNAGAGDPADWILVGEDNLDFEFNTTDFLQGFLYLTLTHYARATSTQGSTNYLLIRVIHYDGSSETTIGTQQQTDTLLAESSKTDYKRTTLRFTISGQKFKAGDKLRIEIQHYTHPNIANYEGGYFCDGADRDPGAIWAANTGDGAEDLHSNLIVQAPFSLRGK